MAFGSFPSDTSNYDVTKQLQVISSSTSEEGWVPSNARSTKRYHHEVGTPPRESQHIPKPGH
jgi:hypothetical protein